MHLLHHPMADRLIQKQEVERLAECTDKSDPLLLAERSFPAFMFSLSEIPSFSNNERISFFFLCPVRLFFSCTFSIAVSSVKIRKSWKKHTQWMLSQVYPLLHGICFDIGFIEIDNSLIIVAIAVKIAAQRWFSGAWGGFYQIHFSFPEDKVLMPYIRGHRITVSKHLGKCLL